jgi:DNA-binding MarR family transcriptional regulator
VWTVGEDAAAAEHLADAAPWWEVEPETRALRHLQTAMTEAELALARRMRLGVTDLAAMRQLAFATHPVGPGWLSHRLGMTPAAATELVDRLERAGHVARERDTADRRRVRLVATTSAIDEVGSRIAPLLQALDRTATEFTDAERAVIRRFLAALIKVYGDFAEP